MRRFRLRCFTIVACVLLVPLLGCQKYGEVGDSAYALATAIYSATNRQSLDGLDVAETKIAESREAEDLTDREAEWFAKIIEDARDGSWKAANLACRRMMEEQVHAADSR